jgi:membrane-associated protease RseP (regulator of RpoE activity)
MHNLDEVDPVDEPRTYRQQNYFKRMSVALAGSAMHFLIAFVLLIVLHSVVGVIRYDKGPLNEIGEISRLENGPSPAQEAGLRVGDKLVTIDGQPLDEWSELPRYIQDHPAEPIEFVVERNGRPVEITVTPVKQLRERVDESGEPTGK